MLVINYKGETPQQRFYTFAVKGNKDTNVIRFVVQRQQADVNLLDFTCSVKVQNKEHDYLDLIMLNPVYDEASDTISYDWLLQQKTTQYRNLELQLEFVGGSNGEAVWQTLIAEIELNETIKVGEYVDDKELSVLKQMEDMVMGFDRELSTERQERKRADYNLQQQIDNIDPDVDLMISLTYDELKELRDNGELKAGMRYRITDYMTTTTQSNTRSAYHQFDIIVMALNEHELSEDAQAIHHTEEERNVVSFCLSNYGSGSPFIRYSQGDGDYLGKHYFCYKQSDEEDYVYLKSLVEMPCEINVFVFGTDDSGWINIAEETPTRIEDVWVNDGDRVYRIVRQGYFGNAQMNAWKIKYCLDNDTSRFGWALDGQAIINGNNVQTQYNRGECLVRLPHFDNSNNMSFVEYQYAWGCHTDLLLSTQAEIVFSKNPTIQNGELVFSAFDMELVNASIIVGKGVVYYMEDEWGNKAGYDFKNIQFRRDYIREDYGTYTDFDERYFGIETTYDPFFLECPNNHLYIVNDIYDFKWYYTISLEDENGNIIDASLNAKMFLSDEGGIENCVNNDLSKAGYSFGMYDELDVYCKLYLPNIIMTAQYSQIYDFGGFKAFSNNVFGTYSFNITFDYGCQDNIIGNNSANITFGYRCRLNKIGNMSSDIIMCHDGMLNEVGDMCDSIGFDEEAFQNIVENRCNEINIQGSSCQRNHIRGGCSSIYLGTYCSNNTLEENCRSINIQQNSSGNTFGKSCASIWLNESFNRNSFGNNCEYIDFYKTESGGRFKKASHNIFDSGVKNLILLNNTTESAGDVRYYHIHSGVVGTGYAVGDRLKIQVGRAREYETSVQMDGYYTEVI